MKLRRSRASDETENSPPPTPPTSHVGEVTEQELKVGAELRISHPISCLFQQSAVCHSGSAHKGPEWFSFFFFFWAMQPYFCLCQLGGRGGGEE